VASSTGQAARCQGSHPGRQGRAKSDEEQVSQLAEHIDRTLVLVDDSARFLMLVKGMLREFGFETVYDFTDPREAFLFATRRHVDLIMTDLAMEPINGFQFADRVRHADVIVNRVVPIILLTGHAGRKNIQNAIVHGIDEVLVKPLSARHLHDRLLAVFDKPRVYIKTPSGYFGPDRRRRNDPHYRGPERRKADAAEMIDQDKLLAMREEARRKYGWIPPSPLEPEEIRPVLVGPITTIPISVVTTREGNRLVAKVPTPMRPKDLPPADLEPLPLALPESAIQPSPALPSSALEAQMVPSRTPVPIAKPPAKPEPKRPEDVHFLD